MAYPIAWLLFVTLAAACWYTSLACLRGSADDPSAAPVPHRPLTTLGVVLGVSLTSFLHFPLGWAADLLVWAAGAFAGLGLPAGRAGVLFCYLAAGSLVTRLLVLGVLALFGI